MIKTLAPNGNTIWFSQDNDWENKDGHTIAVWQGCEISEGEHKDFIDFVKTEIGADVEPIGTFKNTEDLVIFVFLVKTNIDKFSIWRFKLPGMRWWYDAFWETNGGLEAKESELLPLINKLGLKINAEVNNVYSD